MSTFKLNPQQALAALTLSGPVSIAAGAGSGKTRVLAERAANAVVGGRVEGWEPIPLDRVLAITFTDKAAGELAERIRSTLRDAGEHELANDVDAAWISTIHGMCSRILRASALEAGIDPAFVVLDTVETARLKECAFDRAAREILETPGRDRGLFAEYSYAEVATAVRALSAELARNGLSASDVAREPARRPRDICRDAAERLSELSARMAVCEAPADVATQHVDACSATLTRLHELALSDLVDEDLVMALRRILIEHTVPRRYKGMKELRCEAVAVRDELLADCVAAATHAYAEQLLELTERYADRFDELKRDAGALDFDDLQRSVLALFERRPDVAERWGSVFDLSMVDEFQDTDEQQLRIVRSIAGDNLCTVGDALQSIYRFRGADVEVYRTHNERMETLEATNVALSINYRSHPSVLEFVNRLFGELVGDGLVRLEAGRIEPDPPVVGSAERVELFTCPREHSADEARQALAQRIAERVAELHAAGVALGDIVVLVRSYTHADEYADALRAAGVGALVVGGNRFLDLPEVGCLQAFCRLLGNALDEEALARVLASPLCGLSDDGLLVIRRHAEEASVPLAEALRAARLGEADALRLGLFDTVLSEATGLLGVRPLGEIVLRAFERSGWDLDCLSRGTDGAQAYATVLKFARMADGFDGGRGKGPSAFSEYLDAKRRFGDHEAPPPVAGQSTDVVRIMSVHASKGLEFPVVIVPELDAPRQSDRRLARWTMRPEPRLGMRLSSASGKDNRTTRWFDEIAAQNKDADYAEYLRIFYVAFTRARELLILAGRDAAPSSASMMRSVQAVIERESADPTFGPVRTEWVTPADEVSASGVPLAASNPGPAEVSDWIEAVQEAGYRPYSAHAAPARLSYSGFSAYGSCPRRFRAQHIVGLTAERGQGGGVPASSFGSAVHAALQADVAADDSDRLGRLARYHGLDDRGVRRLRAAIAAYGGSDIAELVERWPGSVRREAPFAIRLTSDAGRTFVLDGTIDLYARDGARALVVDYKTGTSGTDEELLERYALQARCYALAALRDGADDVRVAFVRPEVAVDGRLQRVEYTFGTADLVSIEAGLLGTFDRMCAGRFEARERRDELVCAGCPVAFDCPAVW